MSPKSKDSIPRGWIGFGRNYFHNLGSETCRLLPVDNGDPYSWGVVENENESPSKENNGGRGIFKSAGRPFQYHKEIPKKLKGGTKISTMDGQIAPAACSSAATYFLSGSKHNRITSLGTVHGHVMNPILEEAQGPISHATFSAFANVSPSTTTIPLPLPCVELAAGRHFCLARLEGGLAVCSWGAGHFGQLGHGTTSFSSSDNSGNSNPSNTSTYQGTPKVIERLLPRMVGSPIVQIAAGDWHGMALAEEGTVYAWGCNRNMQCGRKSARANKASGSSAPLQMIPMPVTILDADPDRADDPPVAIAKIAAGKAHSVAITKRTHQVYCWGASHYGQCASNSGSSTRTSKYTRNTTALPRMVYSLQDVHVIDVAAGDRHTLALSQGGRVFSWGAGAEGQLGIFPPIVCTPKPRLVHDLDFVAIAASELQTSQSNNANALASVPTITSVHAAGCSSYGLSSSGHVYAWGSNDAGTLGLSIPPQNQLPYWEVGITPLPPGEQRLLQVRTFDSEHNVLLPRRLDVLRHLDVEQIALGPSHSWFLGETRSSQQGGNNVDGEGVAIGRTLHEVQERKQQGFGGSAGGNGSGGGLQFVGSLNAPTSSFAGSTSAGTTSNWGEDSLSHADAASRSMMSPSSTMPTDEEDDTTTTDVMSASMPALESSDPRLHSNHASTASNGSSASSGSRIRGRRHSDGAINPPTSSSGKQRHFSISNLIKRLGGSRRQNAAGGSARAEESMDHSKNSQDGSKGRFRLRSSGK